VCLQSLTLLDYPRSDFEVIVVDDGSGMPPETVVAAFHDRLDVTLLTQPHVGPAIARNTGAARAKGAFLAFTDDDCIPAPSWLQTLAARFATAPDCAIGGQTLNALPDNPYSTASQLLVDYLYSYYNVDPNRSRFFASNNLAFPTEQFRIVGGFDTTFPLAAGEDRELCDRWLRHGYQMMYAPEATVYHRQALTLRSFWRQHFSYGRGAFRFHQARARHAQKRATLEAKAFYLGILRYPFLQTQGLHALLLATLLAVAQGATAAGMLWERGTGSNNR
jgi:GT2 family glycosyltransferase